MYSPVYTYLHVHVHACTQFSTLKHNHDPITPITTKVMMGMPRSVCCVALGATYCAVTATAVELATISNASLRTQMTLKTLGIAMSAVV